MKKFHQLSLYVNAVYNTKNYPGISKHVLKQIMSHHMDFLLEKEVR